MKEFFLVLSSTGLAYRRCQLAWVNGDKVGVTFLKRGEKKNKPVTRVGALAFPFVPLQPLAPPAGILP
jgi:hypothetical protein